MKILIVGAGIAGPTAAFWLQRAGHEITLVEHSPELRRGGYLIDFWGAGFDVAERMGIVPELRRRGYVLAEARTVNGNGRKIASIRPEVIMKTNDRYLSIPRSDLSAVIYEALGGTVELILGDTVSALDDDSVRTTSTSARTDRDTASTHTTNRVRATFESGTTRDFDLVIGADGLHSRVRRLAFGPDEQYEKYLGMVVAAFQTQHYPRRDELVAMMYADVGFQVLRVTLRDDTTLFLFTLRHDGAVPTDRSAQEDLVKTKLRNAGWQVPAILPLMSPAKDFYFDSVSQIRMPSWTKGRVALVGDAAAAPSFLAGQGSALAMVEAYTLAAELAQTTKLTQQPASAQRSSMRDTPANTGTPAKTGTPANTSTPAHTAAFARYEHRLAPLLHSKQDAAVGLGLAFAPKNRRQLFVRNTVMKMMGLPKVAAITMGRSFYDAVELPTFPGTETTERESVL